MRVPGTDIRDGARKTFGACTTHDVIRRAEAREMLDEGVVHLAALMLRVANRVRNPREIDVAKEIQIGEPFLYGDRYPRRDTAIVLLRVYDGAYQIGVEHNHSARALERLVLPRDLAACDGCYVGDSERSTLLLSVVPSELRDPWYTVVSSELLGELGLSRGLGASNNDPR